jgi:hypothetical protein
MTTDARPAAGTTPEKAPEKTPENAPGTAAEPNLLATEVESELRSNVRALLAARCDWKSVLDRSESDAPVDAELWHALVHELGVTSLPVPEALGGAGASWRETAVVIEELGRAVAPVPFLGSAVLCTAALLALADESAEAAAVLRSLAEGERTGALALPFATAPDSPFPSAPSAVRADASGALTGTVAGIGDARIADLLLVPAAEPDGTPALYAVLLPAAGAELTPVTSLDSTRPVSDLTLSGAQGRRLASGEAAAAALGAALRTGAALLASEQLGTADWALETTVAYVKERHQFGRPIGSFQAVKHRLADLWVSVAQARAVALAAADALATGSPEAPLNAALAQAFTGPVAVTAAEEAVQLHGGIGFTWEHPAHLYLKRAKSASLVLGTADRHRAALGTLADLPA